MASFGAGQRMGDLVQDRIPDLGLARVQGMGAADADHAVLEVAVAETPLGFEEGEGPRVEAVLVHEFARHRGDAGQALRPVPQTPFAGARVAVSPRRARSTGLRPARTLACVGLSFTILP